MTDQKDFNELEYLQSVWIKKYNRDVREAFRDVEEGDTPDFSNPKIALKYCCLAKDNDSIIVMIYKAIFFYIVLRRAQEIQMPVIGMPINQYDQMTKYCPVVTLYFRQPWGEAQELKNPLTAQISIKLVKYTSETITTSVLKKIATRIKEEFMPGGRPYTWFKGRKLISYRDLEHGLRLRLYIRSEQEAIEIIRKICRIADAQFDKSLMTISESADPTSAFPVTPRKIRILNETYDEPRKRPVGKVYFLHAICKIWGKNQPVPLCQSGIYFKNTLV